MFAIILHCIRSRFLEARAAASLQLQRSMSSRFPPFGQSFSRSIDLRVEVIGW